MDKHKSEVRRYTMYQVLGVDTEVVANMENVECWGKVSI